MTVPNETLSPPDEEQAPDPYSLSPSTPEDDSEALRVALADVQAQAVESKDMYMRALAELENGRKRAVRDVEQAHKFAVDRFANDLIGVKDSLELGLRAEASVDALKAGTEATLKLLSRAFEKAGLVELVPLGEAFNPEWHEAMVTQPSAEHLPDTVLQVVQKGYQLNGRLLRPARVIVAREP